MTLTCDLGDEVNTSNACGMPSVTMALLISPTAHNHHTVYQLGGNHNSVYAILGHFRSMYRVSNLHTCILVNKYLQ